MMTVKIRLGTHLNPRLRTSTDPPSTSVEVVRAVCVPLKESFLSQCELNFDRNLAGVELSLDLLDW